MTITMPKYCVYFMLMLMLFQIKAKAQSFSYLHWEEEKNPWSAEIVKIFNPSVSPPFTTPDLIYPVFYFKNSRGGNSHISWNIDYIADDGREFQSSITIPMTGPDSIVHPQFYHFWRNHSGGGHNDTLMLVKAENNKVYRIELQPMTIQEYKSKTFPVKVKITLVRGGNDGGGGGGNPTVSAPTQQVCSITNLPQGWVIIDRVNCICCGGTNAPQWTIKKIDEMPAGSTEQVCSVDRLPTGWVIVDRVNCICCGGTNAPKWTIKKIEGLPSGTSINVCSQTNIPSGWVIMNRVSCICCGGTNAPQWTIKKL